MTATRKSDECAAGAGNTAPLPVSAGERSDRVQGLSALARFQGARSPLAESEAAPQVDPGKAPAQKSATKLRCFARCERRGECRGAVKGSIALQFRSTMIDRSREHCLNALPLMLQHACGERSDRVQGLSPIYASHFRDAIYLNQAEAETLFRVCSANFNLTLFQFFSTNLRENSAGSSALINRK